jgi:very-short-patch-repair endonuclease
MVAKRLLSPMGLRAYVTSSHLDGVLRAREVAEFVRRGSESVQESVLRWELIDAGEPEPELNGNIYNDDGEFMARGDLLYRAERVVVEFDGWYHERSSAQRQRDLRRRELLEAAGWTVVIVTTADLRAPAEVVARVREARRRSRFGRNPPLSA